MTRGCNHKKERLARQAAEEHNKRHPEPMFLFQRRWENGEVPEVAPSKFRRLATMGQEAKAAEAMAAWDNSDPFAGAKTRLYVRQGFLDADKVVKEMHQRTLARRVAREREVDRMMGREVLV